MSSDEDEGLKPPVKKQRIYFGSLEEQERERIEREEREKLAAEELLRAQGSETSESDSSVDEEDDGTEKKKKKKKKKLRKTKGSLFVVVFSHFLDYPDSIEFLLYYFHPRYHFLNSCCVICFSSNCQIVGF